MMLGFTLPTDDAGMLAEYDAICRGIAREDAIDPTEPDDDEDDEGPIPY